MTAPVRPMLATPGAVPDGPGWAYEFKWDGVRAVARFGADPRLWSRNGRDVTASYPELAHPGADVLVDGEIVSLTDGVPSFEALQARMHVARPGAGLLRRHPVAYYAFDLLADHDEWLLAEPYRRRRARLVELLGADAHPVVPPHFTGDGGDVLDTARRHGLEGVVAKRLDSRYEPGVRSPAWVKTPLTATQEVVVGGWSPGRGRRAGGIGALLVGVHDDDGRLRYAGHVGTGFSDAALDRLARRLAPLARPTAPFDEPVPRAHARDARWVAPELVGEVEYRMWTRDGRLRAPAWRGLRPDREPGEVRRADPPRGGVFPPRCRG